MNDEINMNSLVLMHYSIALTNGQVIESSFDEEPVEIIMGHGDVSEGMELALYGLKQGESQTLTLTAEQGFGLRDEGNINMMPLSDFPGELQPEVGTSYSFETPSGEEISGTILKIEDDQAEVDFNHPLAGHEIVFTVNIIGVNNTHSAAEQT